MNLSMQDVFDQILDLVKDSKAQGKRSMLGGVGSEWLSINSYWDGSAYRSVMASNHPDCSFPLTRTEAISLINAIYDELPADFDLEIAATQAESLAIWDAHIEACKPKPPKIPNPPRPPRPGWVYLMKSDSGLHKIGVTCGKDCEQRKSEIQKASGHHLEVVTCKHVPDAYGCESRLHALFADCRKNGEWFEFDEFNRTVAIARIERLT